VLQAGRIVAEGRFEDLKNTSSVFLDLWKHQEEKRKA
jgi:ABC-type transport system involved in cytochrome bd biosynthesis fused ATPase/permease subunit